MKRVVIKTSEAVAYQGEAMECGDHFKNGASSKSHTSRGNFFNTIFFALLVASVVFGGCKKDKDDKVLSPEEEVEMVTVGMKSVGELVGTETPLTKSGGNAKPLWGIQVYLVTEREEQYYWEGAKVAYGVFDDISEVTLTLNKNRKYSIEATYMPNGQNEIQYLGGCWAYPFSTIGGAATPINQVIYNTSAYIHGLASGVNDGGNLSNAKYNEMDRYYGFVAEYTPVEGGTIEIDMKRTVFGLTFIGVNAEDFVYDNFVVQLDANAESGYMPKEYTLNVDKSQPTSQLVIPLICLMGVRASALDPGYVEKLKISLGIEGNPALIFYGDINVKRNTMHTYTFDMNAETADSGVNPIFDDGEMENEMGELN